MPGIHCLKSCFTANPKRPIPISPALIFGTNLTEISVPKPTPTENWAVGTANKFTPNPCGNSKLVKTVSLPVNGLFSTILTLGPAFLSPNMVGAVVSPRFAGCIFCNPFKL